ncbi:MAG TPA: UTP--glucose-1-phosphate uridylyltransferase [Ruminiclostridium sp.]|nr:UTP--glucose-1-phosphate uridylyltransferase [Ruminiclostridium sp.]
MKFNNDGVGVTEMGMAEADDLVDIWLSVKHFEKLEIPGDIEKIELIKKVCTYDRAFFEDLQTQYMSGKISIKNNIRGSVNEISNISVGEPGSNIFGMPDIGTVEYDRLFHDGAEILKEPIAYVILNGGESTRFGVKTIRGLNPAFNFAGKYCSLIELKMRHVAFMNKSFGSSILPVFVNSFFTNQNTMRVLKQNNFFGVNENDVYNCVHQVIHRVYPKAEDLVYWHETLREKGLTNLEEELAEQSLKFMKEWTKQKGEGAIFKPEGKNKLYTLVSPGHYFSFMSIISNYTLGFLIERGVKRIMVASNDNMLATVNPAILAFHQSKGHGATVEVVPRLFDRGGAPVTIGGKTVILEDFSFPDQESLWKVPYFNPISSWIDIDKLLQLAELAPDDLVQAAHGNTDKRKLCSDAVIRLGNRIQTYAVLKQIAEDMGNGIVYTYPVIQFEKLYGDLVGLLDPTFLLVPKILRHTQMKSVDHIYQILVDRALEILEPQLHI